MASRKTSQQKQRSDSTRASGGKLRNQPVEAPPARTASTGGRADASNARNSRNSRSSKAGRK